MVCLIAWAINMYHVDPTRVYAEGGSMGAWGTATFALRHPEVFAARYPNRPRRIQRGLPSLVKIASDTPNCLATFRCDTPSRTSCTISRRSVSEGVFTRQVSPGKQFRNTIHDSEPKVLTSDY